MKKIHLLIIMLLMIGSGLSAQTYEISFVYDDAGNREFREMIELIDKSKEDTTEYTEAEIEEELKEIEEKFSFDMLDKAKIKVFPNPVQGALMVRLENIASVEGIDLQLYNSQGSLLKTEKLSSSYMRFDMSGFSPGMYILKVVGPTRILDYKIIKK